MSVSMHVARGASAFTIPERWPSEEFGSDHGLAEGEQARMWGKLIDELLRIRSLNDDWDGEGTNAPHRALVDGAIALAQVLKGGNYPPAERVIASVNGTVYFEWHLPQGYLEIEVTSPLDAESRWVPKGHLSAEVVSLTRRP